jgi:hypothetical protein
MKACKAILAMVLVLFLGACEGGFMRESAGAGSPAAAGYNVANP